MSNLEVVKSYTVPKTEIIVDLDQTEKFYATLACVPAGKKEANDAFVLESVTVNGEKMLKFRFKSEAVGGFALFGSYNGDYSNYEIYLTENGKVFATSLNSDGVADMSVKYGLDEMDRVSLILSQAIACYAYAMAEDGYMTPFADFLALAKEIDKKRDLKTLEGTYQLGEELPCKMDDIWCNFYYGMSKQ